MGFAKIVLQFVDFELKVRLVQRTVRQEVMAAEVNEVQHEGGPPRNPQFGPRGHEQQRGAEETEQERRAQSDFVPPQRHAELRRQRQQKGEVNESAFDRVADVIKAENC